MVVLPFILLSAIASQPDNPVALTGLDPVKLVHGSHIAGRAGIRSKCGRFTYLFATTADKSIFDRDPNSYAVRQDGTCLRHPGMPGDPSRFVVVGGKIYLAGSSSCLATVKPDPDPFVKRLEARKRVAIMIFPGVQIIDYSGPYEVFGQAGYDVFTVAAKPDALYTNMLMHVTPSYTFDNCPKPDIIVLPGGSVPNKAEAGDPYVNWVKKMAGGTPHIMSVCNGAFWLANAHLLDGKDATTFYGLLEQLQSEFPKIHVHGEKRFTDNGQIMCTAGLSSGIDGALKVVEKLQGLGTAKSIALGMEYNWQPTSDFAKGAFADKYLIRLPGRSLDLPERAEAVPIDVTDNRELFEKSWRITGARESIPALMGRISKQLKARWQPVEPIAASAESATGDWTFTGDDKLKWSAHVTVKPDTENRAGQILSIRIQHVS